MARAILLVDIDAFFAQAEQVLRPDLKGRPVIVGGLASDRSVVASASYEARARGVRTAMPIRQAHRLCPDAAFLRGDFHAYQRFSEQLEAIARRYTPLVEPASLDEVYLDISDSRRYLRTMGVAGDGPGWPIQVAAHLKRAVRAETGLAVSVGAGTSRLVAKIACDGAKPDGIAGVRPGYEAAFLSPLPLARLPGVGPQTARRLEQYNLRRIGDLARMPKATLAAQFGPFGETLAARARGEDPTPVEAGAPDAKSISRETTFEADRLDRRALLAMLSYLLERCGRRLRGLGAMARTVSVKVRYADFQTVMRRRCLPVPSDHDDDFWPAARALFEKAHTRRVGVRLVGVALSGLVAGGRQTDFFAEPRYQRRRRFYRSLDRVRERFGFAALVAGRAIELMPTHPRDEHGFRLRTSCLSR